MALLLKAGADWDIKDYRGRKPEELIYDPETTTRHFKTIFDQFRDAEEEKRRKASEEKGLDENHDDEHQDPASKVSIRMYTSFWFAQVASELIPLRSIF